MQTIDDAKAAKRKLEENILKLVQQYEHDFGLRVVDFNLIRQTVLSGPDSPVHMTVTVKI